MKARIMVRYEIDPDDESFADALQTLEDMSRVQKIKSAAWDAWNEARVVWKHDDTSSSDEKVDKLYKIMAQLNDYVQGDDV